jgi:hypothetical protein
MTFDGDATDPFVEGRRHLVFGRRTELGTLRKPAIVPFGYFQGVFTEAGPSTVANMRFGEIDRAVLEAEVERIDAMVATAAAIGG